MKIALALSLFLGGCTHAPLRVPDGGGLYPFGAYKHHVKIQMLLPQPRAVEMNGAVSVNAEKLRVVGLSSFGTTVFRIEEDLKTGVVKREFYLEAIEKNSSRFMEFYYLIRELLTAPKGSTEFERRGAHFTVSEPDKNGIYRKVHVTHPQVVLDVEVTGYEF